MTGPVFHVQLLTILFTSLFIELFETIHRRVRVSGLFLTLVAYIFLFVY